MVETLKTDEAPKTKKLTLRVALLAFFVAIPFGVLWTLIVAFSGLLGGFPSSCPPFSLGLSIFLLASFYALILFYPTRFIARVTHTKVGSIWIITHIPGALFILWAIIFFQVDHGCFF